MSLSLHHYRKKRRVHHTVLGTMLLVAGLSVSGIFIILMQVKGASSTLFSFTINDPSAASPVTSQPPTAITIPGASYPVAYRAQEGTPSGPA
ncbi:MAG: hypothetical protein AAB490_03960, partial [Patescibacteria group bacterium]